MSDKLRLHRELVRNLTVAKDALDTGKASSLHKVFNHEYRLRRFYVDNPELAPNAPQTDAHQPSALSRVLGLLGF